MLKRMVSKKIMIGIASLFALFLIYLIPNEESLPVNRIPNELEYTSKDIEKGIAYLLTNHGYLGRTEVFVSSDVSVERKARELLEVLIQGGSGESRIPSGFQALIPSDTKIIGITFEDDILKVNFSKELLEGKEEIEEKIIESIVYTLTSIKEVSKVLIYVDGNVLSRLPKSGIYLPPILDRHFGINKSYEFSSLSHLNQVTIYYIDKYNEDYYYVPVTKYVNDEREKIKIIIDEMTSQSAAETNLMSFLNSHTKLLQVEQMEDSLDLVFNNYLFEDLEKKNVLEEVIYTISLSVKDNYDVKEVVFEVENEEIHKTDLKMLE